MSGIEEDLLNLITPVVERAVREALAESDRPHWRWASIRQAAEMLDISEGAIKARLKRRQLPYVVLEGRRYIDLEQLDEQLQSLRQ